MPKQLHIRHVKSSQEGKAPSASTLNYGEIAVNYNVNSPALYIKDSADDIVKFEPLPEVTSSDNGKVLQVVNGDWEAASGITVYVGETGVPPASLGQEGDIYLQATPIEYVQKPVTVYETDGTTGLLGINSDMDTTTWQLTGLDLSAFTYVTAYIKQADVPLTGTDHLYATPALMVNIPLDEASKSSRYDAYVGGAGGTNMQDRDVHFTVLCAVDSTKTKFKVLSECSIAGTLLGDRNTNGRYCYKIVGHYD